MMKHDIEYIIANILSGEATDNEVVQFEQWLKADKKNEQKFLSIKAYWNSHIKYSHNLSVESLYNELFPEVPHIKKGMGRKQKKAILYLSIITSIAACFLLLFNLFDYTEQEKSNITFFEFKTTTKIDTIVLPDQSKIILNKNSKLIYTNEFGQESRSVIIEGEAFFDIAKNEKIPFIVNMQDKNKISVLGTIFNIRSYHADKNINIVLLEGSIKFQTEKNQVILSPNQELIYNKDKQEMEVVKSDSDLSLFWLYGMYKCKSIALKDLMNNLSKMYNVNINLSARELSNTTISGSFHSSQSIEEVLTIVSRSLPIQWTKNGKDITVSKIKS